MVIGNAPFQDDPSVKMYEKILVYDVDFPEHPQLTNRVTDLINRLLEKEAYKRLGAGKNGAKHIKSHPWFTVKYSSVLYLCLHGDLFLQVRSHLVC